MSAHPIERSQIPAAIFSARERFERAGYAAWIVGGCVRDLLLGRPIHDWDLCTSARPEEVRALFPKVIPTGIAHGTVTALWQKMALEITTLRGEGAYTDGRHPDEVYFVQDIAEDLARRDFTVNAIALDPREMTLVDPYGGERDLQAKLLRAVGDPAIRFAEDGLRILRGARFVASLGFSLEPATEAAFAGALGAFSKVSPERVQQEWIKTLATQRASPAFVVMQRTGILARTFPALHALPEGAFEASLRALDDTIGAYPLRLVSLFHRLPTADVKAWLRAYRFSNADSAQLLALLQGVQALEGSRDAHLAEDRLDPATLRRAAAISGRAHVASLASLAGILLSPSLQQATLDAARDAPLSVGELAIGGAEIIAIAGAPGRHVGEVLRALLDLCLDDPSLNDASALQARAEALLQARVS